jgi:hypothetical protein
VESPKRERGLVTCLTPPLSTRPRIRRAISKLRSLSQIRGRRRLRVRVTLYDKNGLSVTFRDFQVPSLGTIALIFSRDPSQHFGGFGQVMFPQGQDFNGLVAFQVVSPSGGSIAAMVLQYIRNSMSSVEVNSQRLSAVSASGTPVTRCAEFAMGLDGNTVQYQLP